MRAPLTLTFTLKTFTPHITFIAIHVHPMPNENQPERALRTGPQLATAYLNYEYMLPGYGMIGYAIDIDVRIEISLGKQRQTDIYAPVEREVFVHELYIPEQSITLTDPEISISFEGRLSDVRLWCFEDAK